MPKELMYNPEDKGDRRALATAILTKLVECKFLPEDVPVGTELVYYLPVKETGMFVKVFTSIVDGEVRTVGADAIRIAGVFKHKNDIKGITSEKRINRAGEIPEIVDRMYQRMRSVYKGCNQAERCKNCGAPKFLAKSGNKVCAAICWVKE